MPASMGPMVLERKMNLLPPTCPDVAQAHNKQTIPRKSHFLINNLLSSIGGINDLP
jgi:hypothetical protein